MAKYKDEIRALAREKGRDAALEAYKHRSFLLTEPLLDQVYPWRKGSSPYRIFLAELLLRKTTAAQAAGVFGELLERYPDPCALAEADLKRLDSLLKPLGLRERALLIKEAASVLCWRYGGRVPCERKALEEIKGVGPYIAGAVLSFGCGKREAIVDTGIARLWGRITGGAITRSYSPHRDPAAWEASRAYVESYPGSPSEGNYILLDTSRLICRPRAPECRKCSFRAVCAWGQQAARAEDKL